MTKGRRSSGKTGREEEKDKREKKEMNKGEQMGWKERKGEERRGDKYEKRNMEKGDRERRRNMRGGTGGEEEGRIEKRERKVR